MTEVVWYTKILYHILDGPNFIGLMCYLFGAITFTAVQIYFRKEVVEGLKGENGKWEAPEWIVYLAAWLFPHMVMTSGFLETKYPDWAWIFMMSLIMFGLTGRWGLEWLLAMRNKTTITQETKTEHTEITSTELTKP